MTPQVSERPHRLALIPSSLRTMILNLLIPALILGVVEAQTANRTEGELSGGHENQTFITSTADYSTLKPGNLTTTSYKDELHRIEEELQNNQTTAVITEEDEDFQDQEIMFPGKHCQQDMLVDLGHMYCGDPFHQEMKSISAENWCDLEKIIRPYHEMTLCLEKLSNLVNCYYPNSNIQDFFLEIHSFYFHNCSNEELLVDAPQGLVIALTVIPVSLIPVLVYLVVWKSKMVGYHCIPWINTHTSGSYSVTSVKQEQEKSSSCLRNKTACHRLCQTLALSALCLLLFVVCVALSVLYNRGSDGKPERKSFILELQNISDSQHTLSKANTELRRDNEALKEQNKILNRTSAKLHSVTLTLSLERSELTEQILNLTSTNLQLSQELERLLQITADQEEKELNMSQTIQHLRESNTQREEEKRGLTEATDLLREELKQEKEKNQELLEINDKIQTDVKNLSQRLEDSLNDDCEERNAQLQERVMELQEKIKNLSGVLMKERQEAAEREERTNKMDQTLMNMRTLQEDFRSLDLYCPVVNPQTKERSCKKCPDSWKLFDSSCYYISSRTLTWSSSRAWCRTQGGDLLVINSEREQRFVFESSRAEKQSGSRLWIGMTDAEVEGEWSWVDGSRVTSNIQFWLSRAGTGTEPDNWTQDDPAGEDCGHIDNSESVLRSWMDGSCKNSYRWICEKSL
ncbi:hypothetical protein L3Q82_010159 [Xyrichtys novacula]|uniref:C-type lectin domain-containing protein n=1 Tax=Xyrichtys novacula TaxID=13765 RepID=A0AAV1HB30_XYRNO|nr:hypothetical protein L3Q82_010159 [Xyrichtys novacula]